MTADALGADNLRLARFGVESNGLMAAILTRDITPTAADAAFMVYLREHFGVAVEVRRQYKVGQLLGHKIVQMADSPLFHVGLQAQYEVIDDAVAVLHDGGTHLNIAASQLDELQRVAPSLNAPDATVLHVIHNLARSHLVNIAQGDRFHGAS